MPPKPNSTSASLPAMSQPPLHPDRLRAALKALDEERDADPGEFGAFQMETFRAACEAIRKAQLAVGLTGKVVDTGNAALELLGT